MEETLKFGSNTEGVLISSIGKQLTAGQTLPEKKNITLNILVKHKNMHRAFW